MCFYNIVYFFIEIYTTIRIDNQKLTKHLLIFSCYVRLVNVNHHFKYLLSYCLHFVLN